MLKDWLYGLGQSVRAMKVQLLNLCCSCGSLVIAAAPRSMPVMMHIDCNNTFPKGAERFKSCRVHHGPSKLCSQVINI